LAFGQRQAATPAATPPRPIAQLVHTTWTPKEGGGPKGVTSLAQTTDGYLWIGTFFGLVRFDGVRFVRYTPLDGDTLPGDDPVNRLLATQDGSLWMIGGRGGVVTRLRNGRAVTYGKADGLEGVLDLAESSKGMLVAGSLGGLFRFSGGKWEAAGPGWNYPGKEARAVWFDRDDALWVETEDRVVYLPAGGHQFLDPGIPVRSAPMGCQFAQERDGTIWFSELGVSAYTLHKVGEQATRRTEIAIESLAILIDRKGSLWLASGSDGLRRVPDPSRIRGRRIARSGPEAERFTMKDGLLNDLPTAVLQDREGNVWVGSSTGLERFREGVFTPVPALAPARPRFVMAGRDSSVWTGAFNYGALQRFGPRMHRAERSSSTATPGSCASRAPDSSRSTSARGPGMDSGTWLSIRRAPSGSSAWSPDCCA
jgi:ligand-binding sensor domain-containing protein